LEKARKESLGHIDDDEAASGIRGRPTNLTAAERASDVASRAAFTTAFSTGNWVRVSRTPFRVELISDTRPSIVILQLAVPLFTTAVYVPVSVAISLSPSC